MRFGYGPAAHGRSEVHRPAATFRLVHAGSAASDRPRHRGPQRGGRRGHADHRRRGQWIPVRGHPSGRPGHGPEHLRSAGHQRRHPDGHANNQDLHRAGERDRHRTQLPALVQARSDGGQGPACDRFDRHRFPAGHNPIPPHFDRQPAVAGMRAGWDGLDEHAGRDPVMQFRRCHRHGWCRRDARLRLLRTAPRPEWQPRAAGRPGHVQHVRR